VTDSTIDPWTRQPADGEGGAPAGSPASPLDPDEHAIDQSYVRSPRWPSLDRLPYEPPVRWDSGLSDRPWPDKRRGGGGPAPGHDVDQPVDRTKLLVILGVLCALLLLAVVVLAGYLVGQSNEAAAPTTTTATTAPPSSTTPPPTPSVPGTTPPLTTPPTSPPTTVNSTRINDEVNKLEQFVAQTRGLTFKQPVKATVLDEQSFKDRIGSDIDKQKNAIQAEGTYLKTLGIIPADTDYFSEYRTLYVDNVIGEYSVQTKELLVKGTEVNDHVRTVLVHELTHAIDDQNFNLDRDAQYKDAKNEIRFGFTVLVEGDAVHVANQFVKTLPQAEQQAELQGQPGGPVPGLGANSASDPIAQSLAAPYPLGDALVTDILNNGGLPELNKDFNDPPTTSEQAMHPEKYRVREPALDVALPPTDNNGPGTDLGMVGEFTTGQMLTGPVDHDTALTAAAGWGGDHGVSYNDAQKNLSCIRIDYKMDTPQDFTELQTAFTAWQKAADNRTVETPTPDTLRVTTCIPPPPSGGSTNPL
jgi:hypothetical protein